MNILAYYLKSRIKNNSKGFTLIELLVAIAMASIVMLGLGTGLVALLSNSNTSAAKNDLKDQLNRAADYINEDIKRSRIANVDLIDLNGDGTKETKALILTYFDSITDKQAKTINYYLADANDDEPWRGPKVLMRIQDAQANGLADNTSQVLVDSLTENAITSSDFACDTTVSSGYHASTTIDPTPGAEFAGEGGFQACVKKLTPTQDPKVPSYSAKVALFGEIKDLSGNDPTSAVLSVDTDTIARSTTPSLDTPVIAFDEAATKEEIYTTVIPDLKWNVILGATSYNLYKCETDTSQCVPGEDDFIAQATLEEYDVTSAPTDDKRACFAVKAVNAGASISSDFSNTVCTIINYATAPAAVTDLKAWDPRNPNTLLATDPTASSDAIQPILKWTRDEKVYEYFVYRCQTTTSTSTCDADPAQGGTLISSFLVNTDSEFLDNVPWDQSKHGTTTTPAQGTAFCYKVIGKNPGGLSAVSNTACGAKIPLDKTLKNNWAVPVWGTGPSGIRPQGMTWTWSEAPTTGPYYEVGRCTTTGTTCDPNPANNANAKLFNTNAQTNKTSFNESEEPPQGSRFCYAIRGSSDTEYSNFTSPPRCGDLNPLQCKLDLADFGLGVTKNTTQAAALRDSSTEAKRTALRTRVTFTGTITTVNDNTLTGGLANPNQLFRLEVGTTNATDMESITQPCTTSVKLTWNYSTTITTPTMTLTSTAIAGYPQVTWTDTSSSAWINPATYVLKRCTTTGTTCPVDDTNGSAVTPTGTRIYLNTNTTGSNSDKISGSGSRRYCYAVKTQQLDSITGATYSSPWSTVQCGQLQP